MNLADHHIAIVVSGWIAAAAIMTGILFTLIGWF